MKRVFAIPALIVMLCAIAVYAANNKSQHFSTSLTGDKEVPPVQTSATGKATFKLTDNGDSLDYTVKVSKLDDPTMAHIHFGAPGTNGPVVVVLYPLQNGEAAHGQVLAKGTIADSRLVGPMQGKTIADLVDAIKAGNAYVNVHTKSHPNGEIRGWIAVKSPKY